MSVSRPAQYRSSAGSAAAARQNSTTRPGPTARPSSRSARAKATKRTAGSATEELRLDSPQVVVVLQRPPERGARGLAVRAVGAEELERACPVDRLRDPRRLVEVERAKLRDRLGDGARKPLRHLGR